MRNQARKNLLLQQHAIALRTTGKVAPVKASHRQFGLAVGTANASRAGCNLPTFIECHRWRCRKIVLHDGCREEGDRRRTLPKRRPRYRKRHLFQVKNVPERFAAESVRTDRRAPLLLLARIACRLGQDAFSDLARYVCQAEVAARVAIG